MLPSYLARFLRVKLLAKRLVYLWQNKACRGRLSVRNGCSFRPAALLGIETMLFGGRTPAPWRGGRLRWLVTNASMSTELTASTTFTTAVVTTMIVAAIAALLQGWCHRFNAGAGTWPGRGDSDSFITSAFTAPAVTSAASYCCCCYCCWWWWFYRGFLRLCCRVRHLQRSLRQRPGWDMVCRQWCSVLLILYVHALVVCFTLVWSTRHISIYNITKTLNGLVRWSTTLAICIVSATLRNDQR